MRANNEFIAKENIPYGTPRPGTVETNNKRTPKGFLFLCQRFCLLRKAVALVRKNRLGKELSPYQGVLLGVIFPAKNWGKAAQKERQKAQPVHGRVPKANRPASGPAILGLCCRETALGQNAAKRPER